MSTARAPAYLLLTFLVLACQPGDEPVTQRSSATSGTQGVVANTAAAPQATSLSGRRLYPLERDPETATRLNARLDTAQARYDADPDDADALVWLGRHYAYNGLYRDAIDVFTEGMGKHPDDPRFYRHRGHRYITVRELDRAVADLEIAARMVSGEADVVEPDGLPNAAGIPRSTLQTNIWYHLGLTHYLRGEYEAAAHAYRRGYEISPNDDMRVAMADWLWLSLARLGREAEAEDLLEAISPDMEILENQAYLDRLLLYRGALTPDSIRTLMEIGGPLDVATYGYGLGAWALTRGNEILAREVFRSVLDTGYWPAFGYLAAEAELHAIGELVEPTPPQSSRPLNMPAEPVVDST